ncbi:MAG: fused MFS/spermidine synthase [Acidobacteria bacterium]|nr:fused MFS/spermidine synthase [Acidobacteriota bacterium]
MIAHRTRRVLLTVLFALTLFAGSALLFLLEPMVGRMLLPRLGGAPAVWNTCLVFFQIALLGGYLYARLLAKYLSPNRQIVTHAVVVLLPLVLLPVHVVQIGLPPTEHSPVMWLLVALVASVGLPFLVVATTAPLLQQWFSHTDHPDATDPYFLYQASNLGSFAALLAYPSIVEPLLGLRMQSMSWSFAYGAFVLLVLACAYYARRYRATNTPVAADVPEERSGRKRTHRVQATARDAAPAIENRPVSWPMRLRWVALAAVPSSLLMGVTTYLSTDVAAVPLLWVIPLALYLLTFVVAFAQKPIVSTGALTLLMPMLVLPLLLILMMEATRPAGPLGLLHVVTFVVVALLCHRQLADARPDRTHLTSFYLWMSIGGAVGGLFNAVAAPLLFRSTAEYPIVLAAACFLKPPRGKEGEGRVSARDVWLPAALGVLAFGLVRTVPSIQWLGFSAGAMLAIAVSMAVCYAFSARPFRFGLAVTAVLVASMAKPNAMGTVLDTERSFFGMHRVVDDRIAGIRWLFHGTTIHGGQNLASGKGLEPLTYYTRSGPLGQLLTSLVERGRPLKVAVVGLGAGGVASYSRAGDSWTFFEIDPVVVHLARDSGYFSFLRDMPAPKEIVVGDGRLTLGRSTKLFNVVFLDAFSSDAVPIHLLTREAVQTYLAHLEPGGVLVFNTSNRYLAVHRVIADLAADAGLVHLWQHDAMVTEADIRRGKTASQFVVLARKREDFGALADSSRWLQVPGARGRVWTDDYANPFGMLIW